MLVYITKLIARLSASYNLEALIEHVKQLRKKHPDYEDKKENYDMVSASLLWTLEQGLKEDFTAKLNKLELLPVKTYQRYD
jgi:hemoglobin-like flavoprotein